MLTTIILAIDEYHGCGLLDRGSLNSLDLRNGGVALYLENFNKLELLRSVP